MPDDLFRILRQDWDYLIEENPNCPAGEGNLFLVKEGKCVGGIREQGGEGVATLSEPWDEELETDCRVVGSGSREEAIDILWEERFGAYY